MTGFLMIGFFRHTDRLWSSVLRIAVASLIVLCILFSGISYASNTHYPLRNISTGTITNFADSIRNGNNVYSAEKAGSLIRYLKALDGEVPEDSIRLYATEGLIAYTWFLMSQNEWFLTGELIDKAIEYCPPDNKTLYHQIQAAKGGNLLFNGEYDKAGEILIAVNRYFSESADTTEWLKSCVNLGLYYTRIHNKPKALEYYSKVLQIAENPNYENYYSIVSGYAENVEEDSIINQNTFEKALRISQKNGYIFLLASNYNDLAQYYFRMENYHEAMANARNALKYAEKYGQNKIKISALGIMAHILYLQKNYAAAYDMESRRFAALTATHANEDRNIYRRINYIDSLISWLDENVPVNSVRNVSRPHTTVSDSGNIALWICLSIILILLGALFFSIRKYKSNNRQSKHNISEDKNDGFIENAHATQEPSIPEGAMTIKIIAESFNPMLDRIRSELKDIPKTGDSDIDSRIRNLSNRLLQSRLPEIDNELYKAIKSQERNFSDRIMATYPDLTKNDLRIATYIRCGLGLQEISSVSGLQPKSVNQARYRLRKSLGLGQDDSLEAFIASF